MAFKITENQLGCFFIQGYAHVIQANNFVNRSENIRLSRVYQSDESTRIIPLWSFSLGSLKLNGVPKLDYDNLIVAPQNIVKYYSLYEAS